MNNYTVIIERGSTNWGAWSPDLNVYATGDTREDVEREVRDAIAFHLDGLREDGLPVPEPAADAITVSA